jgi:hypothetical protein
MSLLRGCAGEDVLVTEGYRDKAGQDKEFNEGSSHVKFPFSFHNHGVAIDLVPVMFGQTWVVYGAAGRYENIARMARQAGFDWGFQMWGFDKPHFQYTQGHGIEHFIQGGKLSMEVAKAQAHEYYEQQLDQMQNALKFAKPARAAQLREEIRYLWEWMKK